MKSTRAVAALALLVLLARVTGAGIFSYKIQRSRTIEALFGSFSDEIDQRQYDHHPTKTCRPVDDLQFSSSYIGSRFMRSKRKSELRLSFLTNYNGSLPNQAHDSSPSQLYPCVETEKSIDLHSVASAATDVKGNLSKILDSKNTSIPSRLVSSSSSGTITTDNATAAAVVLLIAATALI